MKHTRINIRFDPRQVHSENCTIDARDRPLIVFDAGKGRLWVKGPNIDVEYCDVVEVTCSKTQDSSP